MAETSSDGGGGQDLPGDYYEHGKWHQGYYSVAVDDVSKMAGRSHGLIDQLGEIHTALTHSELPSSVLGDNHGARGLVNAWNDAISTRLTDLKRLSERTETLPERLAETGYAYAHAEEQNVRNGNGVVESPMNVNSVQEAKHRAEDQRKDDKVLEKSLKDRDINLWNSYVQTNDLPKAGSEPVP